MKKNRLMLVLAMLAVVTAVSAQVSLGVKGGVNMSNFYADELDDKNVKIGFNVGLLADIDFSYNSAIQTGLFFTTKGAKYSSSIGSANADVTINPMYLQLPVHYAYKVDVTPGTRVVFHAGPYAAYGVGGKTKLSGSLGDYSGETEFDVFGDEGSLKRFDAGLGLGVGAEFGPILVDLGWDMGLVNISDSNDGEIKNQNAYLSVGYKF
ncbi:MAG: porin family protein [Fermentimonas sp.]|jgi:hypothetical protein|nr:porin family protein [Fermentimonas sp.]MDD4696832.1 porin family protein [Fermentimonas sp.]